MMVATTVFKYLLQLTPVQVLELPAGANIVSVQLQRRQLSAWAEIDPEQPKIKRKIYILGTGHILPADAEKHLASVQPDDIFVWHVYQGPLV